MPEPTFNARPPTQTTQRFTPHPASRYDDDDRSPWRMVLVALVVVGGAVAAYFYFRPTEIPAPPVIAPVTQVTPAPTAEPTPEIEFPIEQVQQDVVKPPPAALTLQGSDGAAQKSLAAVFGGKALAQFFRVDNFVRRLVATVDALPREKASQNLMPLKPTTGKFITARVATGAGGAPVIAPENALRYDPLVQLFVRMDTKALVGAYASNYALFQQAYRELGYPKSYFNDRLVAAIDSLLATPDIPGPIALTQPKVLYEFARPELEALPAGQKVMLRMGSENARTVKAKLREVRKVLTGKEFKQ